MIVFEFRSVRLRGASVLRQFVWMGFFLSLAVTGILVIDNSPVWADAGHGAAKSIVVSPRVEARFDDKQMVLVYANRQVHEDEPIFNFGGERPTKFADPRLVLFLENFIDGAPVAGAKIELMLNFIPQPLSETAPGIYQSEKVILGGGRNEVEVNYEIGGESGTVTMMLVIPGGAASTTGSIVTNVPPPTVPGWVYAAGGLVIYLIITALFWTRRATIAAPPHPGQAD